MNQIEKLSNRIAIEAPSRVSYFPLDRFYLINFINEIKQLGVHDFVFYNLENVNTTYTVQLLVCLPELWEELSLNALEEMVNKFTNEFSFYAFIEFTYKYLRVDFFYLIFSNELINSELKISLLNHFWLQCENLFLDELEIEEFEKSMFGVTLGDFNYSRQRLLIHEQVNSAHENSGNLMKYLSQVRSHLFG